MMGSKARIFTLVSALSLDDLVPADHWDLIASHLPDMLRIALSINVKYIQQLVG